MYEITFQASRRQRREEAVHSSDLTTKKLVSKLLQKHALNNVAGTSQEIPSTTKITDVATKKDNSDDIFQLPPQENSEIL